jgi:hypothetical protein
MRVRLPTRCAGDASSSSRRQKKNRKKKPPTGQKKRRSRPGSTVKVKEKKNERGRAENCIGEDVAVAVQKLLPRASIVQLHIHQGATFAPHDRPQQPWRASVGATP